MPDKLMNNPAHWRNRAQQARANAQRMSDPESRRMMLDIAAGYERIAERAERRLDENERVKQSNN